MVGDVGMRHPSSSNKAYFAGQSMILQYYQSSSSTNFDIFGILKSFFLFNFTLRASNSLRYQFMLIFFIK